MSSDILKGNRAVKINSSRLSNDESNQLWSKEGFIYYNMLNFCQGFVEELATSKNIDILEYHTLLNQKCHKFEKSFYNSMRAKMREKMYNDQVKEYSGNYVGIYHPYNPYLQKYNGAYLRTYQLFDRI
jgi:hypothetical protein